MCNDTIFTETVEVKILTTAHFASLIIALLQASGTLT